MRRVDASYAEARLERAREFRRSAEEAVQLADEGGDGTAAASLVVLAAIAYADAVCARHKGHVNQQNHAAAVQTLRSALGNALPAAEAGRLRRLIEIKDEAHYGSRHMSLSRARGLCADLDRFAVWAERMMIGS